MKTMQWLLAHGAVLTFAGAMGLAGCATAEDQDDTTLDGVADVDAEGTGAEDAEQTGEVAQALGCPYGNSYLGWKAGYKTYCTGFYYKPACDAFQLRPYAGRTQYRMGKVTSVGVWIATAGWKGC